jgi:hypothetical protein
MAKKDKEEAAKVKSAEEQRVDSAKRRLADIAGLEERYKGELEKAENAKNVFLANNIKKKQEQLAIEKKKLESVK